MNEIHSSKIAKTSHCEVIFTFIDTTVEYLSPVSVVLEEATREPREARNGSNRALLPASCGPGDTHREGSTSYDGVEGAGEVKYPGLSECSARTPWRAHAAHPIAAAQMRFSPFALEIKSEQTKFLAMARELGVKIVAYAPLGRSFLTGSITSRDGFDEGDNRLNHPRFAEQNLKDQS
ncbi:uncharacterized protein PAC_04488 [Phialocephala subalpina]|uniref:NADP-dependent oxidoreductase domain-containing protein n=1 Tax=Phialocephala subalpina TaxID=576137 RepID=A0A1L7WPB2_9HELO|nr:uncharacterized protein PAC_04488 [Phialocephala subalpina]